MGKRLQVTFIYLDFVLKHKINGSHGCSKAPLTGDVYNKLSIVRNMKCIYQKMWNATTVTMFTSDFSVCNGSV